MSLGVGVARVVFTYKENKLPSTPNGEYEGRMLSVTKGLALPAWLMAIRKDKNWPGMMKIADTMRLRLS